MSRNGRLMILMAILGCIFLLGCTKEINPSQEGGKWLVQMHDDSFFEEFSTSFLFKNESTDSKLAREKPYYALAEFNQTIYAGGADGLWKFDGDNFLPQLSNFPIYSLWIDKTGNRLLAGTDNAIIDALSGDKLADAQGKVLAILMRNGKILAGTENGLFENGAKDTIIGQRKVHALAMDTFKRLWVATNYGVVRFTDNGGHLVFDESNYLLSNIATSLAPAGVGEMWVGTLKGLCYIDQFDTITAITGAQGLPYDQVTSLFVNTKDSELWIGTTSGAIRRNPVDFNYYNGRRWIPSSYVYQVLLDSNGFVWICTDNGIGRIEFKSWTLEDKAETYEQAVYQRHDRFGLVSSSNLSAAGDLSSNKMTDSDNDGLWTAMYLAALSFKYAVTKDPDTKKLADYHFESLMRLEEVTGIPGLIARSIVPLYEKSLDPACYPYCQWQANEEMGFDWKSDASSDEVTGHFYGYAIYHDLVALPNKANDPTHYENVVKVVHEIASYIVNNDYYLIDWDGEPTTWGVWNPEALNMWWKMADQDPSHYIGLIYCNSLEILSYLRTAYHITQDPSFMDAYHYLINVHGYADIARNADIYLPMITNHSTEELLFLSYYPLIRYEEDPALQQTFMYSLNRSFEINRIEHGSFWNITFGALVNGKTNFDLPIAVDNLRNIPHDLITWSMTNSQRKDIQFDVFPNRSFDTITATNLPPIPPDERAVMKWNGDPFEPDGGDGGYEEEVGTFYLLPYWMARYHGFIIK